MDQRDVISPLTIHEGEWDREWWPMIGDVLVDSEDETDEPTFARGDMLSVDGSTFHGLFAGPEDDPADTVSLAGSNRSSDSIENWMVG
jgi:hypothetical protein